jgi:3-oxoacyl-[acyl-carrier-protein] synthase-3
MSRAAATAHQPTVAITGVGYAVPPDIRTNDDPIFDWLKQHPPPDQNLFQGYKQRRVLLPQQSLVDLMVPAGVRALDDAGLRGKDIDALIGYGSVSDYITPNLLAQVHWALNLPSRSWLLPIDDAFTTFESGLLLAQALIHGGRARNVLIVCGCNWTRYVDYHTAQSISASDGAGAAVLGISSDPTRFSLVDAETYVDGGGYGVMYMQGDRVTAQPPTSSPPYFHINAAGDEAYLSFGAVEPPKLANRLLARNGLTGADVTLMSHQSSAVLIQSWQQAIAPAQYIQTLETFANMTLATVPVNLGSQYANIQKDYLLLLGVGVQLQTTAVLLKRSR